MPRTVDDEVAPVVEELCRLHPQNPISLACRACSFVTSRLPKLAADTDQCYSSEQYREWAEQLRQAAVGIIDHAQSALEACSRSIPLLVYQTIGTVGERLLRLRQPAAAFQHILIQARLTDDPESPAMGLINNMLSSPLVPVCFKTEYRFQPAPDLAWLGSPNMTPRPDWAIVASGGRRARRCTRLLETHGESEWLLRAIGPIGHLLGAYARSRGGVSSLGRSGRGRTGQRSRPNTRPWNWRRRWGFTPVACTSTPWNSRTDLPSWRYCSRTLDFGSFPSIPRPCIATIRRRRKRSCRSWTANVVPARWSTQWEEVPRLWASVRFFGKETDRPCPDHLVHHQRDRRPRHGC